MRAAFIGLGNMGYGMAQNLLRAAIPTTVVDVRPEVVAELMEAGATAAATPAAAAVGVDVVCVAVFDEKQTREVLLGGDQPDGVFGAAPAGCIVVLHSTVSAGFVREMAEVAQERELRLIDAAMTGGGQVAASVGTLTFMVGGAPDAVADARPVLDAMAEKVYHVGDVSAGVTAKIVNNFLCTSHVALVREALAVSRAAGLGEEVLDVINAGGVGSSWVTHHWEGIKAQEASYTTGPAGFAAMWSKDLGLARGLAAELGVEAPLAGFLVDKIVPEVGAHGITG
ncbi:NAD(P)-dependent oxidoreductase [Pseudonocardia kujensis]|uniref:NAD(P)-dependent oxidoreductase n=1 Tax=Pseudonocardia kujensis TaxID=1128675 RepID=UPI001E5DBDC6|nr:NAD(P)-dependent oxidoreductase [Pseudonocardia kujensis]MCE0767795.1 NAD(P)-dependent oxidoreductase [Pseudonocardia kujensis]